MSQGKHLCQRSTLLFLRSLQSDRGLYECEDCLAIHARDTIAWQLSPGWNKQRVWLSQKDVGR